MNIWSNHIKSFGMGNYLGYDHPTGQKGFIPNSDYYDYWYPKQRWENLSFQLIGQGEVLTTPIQLANMVATIANRGYFYKPHFVKKIQKTL